MVSCSKIPYDLLEKLIGKGGELAVVSLIAIMSSRRCSNLVLKL